MWILLFFGFFCHASELKVSFDDSIYRYKWDAQNINARSEFYDVKILNRKCNKIVFNKAKERLETILLNLNNHKESQKILVNESRSFIVVDLGSSSKKLGRGEKLALDIIDLLGKLKEDDLAARYLCEINSK